MPNKRRRTTLTYDNRARREVPKLSDDQYFPDVVPGEEEFYRRKIAEKCFDVPVIKYALQAETVAWGGMDRARRAAPRFPSRNDPLHLQRVFIQNMEPVARRIGPSIFCMEKGQHHSTRLQHRPQPSHHWTHQALIQIVRQIPAKHDIKMRCGILQIVPEKSPAVENVVPLLVLCRQVRFGGGDQQVFAINFVAALCEEADIARRSGPKIENTQRRLGIPHSREFAQTAGAARQLLSGLRRLRLRATR